MVFQPSALSSTSAGPIVTDKCHPEKVSLDVAKRIQRDTKSTMKGNLEAPGCAPEDMLKDDSRRPPQAPRNFTKLRGNKCTV